VDTYPRRGQGCEEGLGEQSLPALARKCGLLKGKMSAVENVEGLRALVSDAIAVYEKDVGHELPDDVKSDIRLTRFLQAHGMDNEKAAKAYKDMLKWRSDVEVEALRKKHLEDVEILKQSSFPHWEEIRKVGEYGPWYIAGKSHSGDLVHLEVIGASDPTLLLAQVPERKILEHYIGFFETRAKLLDALTLETDRMVRTVQIRDLSKFGVSLVQHASAMKVLSTVMKAGSAYYPESSSKVIFVNTPLSFYGVWKVASVALRQRTLDKVMFLQSRYHRELLKYVEPRAIHRLEKMQTLDSHEFIEKGDEEDHLPLAYSPEVVVPAGKTEYFPLWMTRTGPRSKVTLEISPVKGSDSTEIPPVEFSFLTSVESTSVESGHEVSETALSSSAYSTDKPGLFEVSFPESLPEDVKDGFLLATFDNKASWMLSITVPLKATFSDSA